MLVVNDNSIDHFSCYYGSVENSTTSPPSLYFTSDPNKCIPVRYIPGYVGTSVSQAAIEITSDATILSGTMVDYHAGNCIELLPGFNNILGSVFDAYIQGCIPNIIDEQESDEEKK